MLPKPFDTQFNTAGKCEIHSEFERTRKSLGLVLAKLVGSVVMFAVGVVAVMPILPCPDWQAGVISTLLISAYVAVGFFVRPEANSDNMGFVGGMYNDPSQANDNINRWLWNLHCLFGPARFIGQTTVDALTLMGALSELTTEQIAERREARVRNEAAARQEEMRAKLARTRGNPHGGAQELSSNRFFATTPDSQES